MHILYIFYIVAAENYANFMEKVNLIKTESAFTKEEVVDFNVLMKIVLELFSFTKETVKIRLKNIFVAADVYLYKYQDILRYLRFY